MSNRTWTPADDNELIVLLDKDWTIPEIATEMGFSTDTVRKHIKLLSRPVPAGNTRKDRENNSYLNISAVGRRARQFGMSYGQYVASKQYQEDLHGYFDMGVYRN